ncbi:hypothetical protein IWZ03DRAFT_377604 [Phyllosticta citriasiana]|uniref:Uncharacterized protein n=1 Tax=Phyllosticta citriasiana TaxID=595635 RepID=A0ABR1KA19_9PEZI
MTHPIPSHPPPPPIPQTTDCGAWWCSASARFFPSSRRYTRTAAPSGSAGAWRNPLFPLPPFVHSTLSLLAALVGSSWLRIDRCVFFFFFFFLLRRSQRLPWEGPPSDGAGFGWDGMGGMRIGGAKSLGMVWDRMVEDGSMDRCRVPTCLLVCLVRWMGGWVVDTSVLH